MSDIPVYYDLHAMQTLNGAELGPVRSGIPASEALGVLESERMLALSGEYGAGVMVFLRPAGEEKPNISELPPSGALAAVAAELLAARAEHAPIHSGHEAVGVLLEEFIEVCGEVFKKRPDRARLRKELIQLAAMGVRAVEDLEL